MEYEASFETKERFFSTFSQFNLITKTFGRKADCQYPFGGNGGIPMAWREEDKTVFVDTSDSHTLIIGATGSKKSRLLAMPTAKLLGIAGESMIISDPKGEIYNRTASELELNGYKISVINLREPLSGDMWNPLSIPYQFYCNGNFDRAYEFINDISTNLMLSDISIKDPYWDYSASDLFVGLVLLLFRFCKNERLSEKYVNIDNLLLLRRRIFEKHITFEELKYWSFWEIIKDDNIIISSLIGTVSTAPNTQACILGVFDNKMRVFMISPTLLKMLSYNNNALASVGNEKTAIYLYLPDEKTSYHKLVSLFIKQSYEHLIYQAQFLKNNVLPVRVNYILDEFSSLPTIKDFPAMITAARSRNIRFNLIVQSKHQLIQRYGHEAETIQTNCNNWIFLTSREVNLLKEISELCGNRSGGNKPLITISELQRLNKGKGEVLILSGRHRAFKGYLPDIEQYDGDSFDVLDLPYQSALIDDISDNDSNKIFEKLFIKQQNPKFDF